MTIPNVNPYTGNKPTPGQPQPEFNQNMSDELDYFNSLPEELNPAIDGINATATQVANDAASAAASAASAESAVENSGYAGLWPDTGGSALKGETWQTQFGGVPTGEYFVALKDTSLDPVDDNDNWKKSVSNSSINIAKDEIVGSSIFNGSNGATVQNGDVVPLNTTHLRVFVGGSPSLVEFYPSSSGLVSNLSETSATIGGVNVAFSDGSMVSKGSLGANGSSVSISGVNAGELARRGTYSASSLLKQGVGSSKKAIVRRATYTSSIGTIGSRYWIVQKGGSGFLLTEMRRGVTTSNGSLGGDAELLRVTSVFDCVSAWLGRHDFSSQSDPAHWAENTYTPAGSTDVYQHGEAVNKYWSVVGSGATRWIEFNVPFNEDGVANIQFYSTPASATDAEITIDGGSPVVVNLSSAAATVSRIKLQYKAGFYTVRVSQGVSGGLINVFGSNYNDVDKYDMRYPSGMVSWGNGKLYTNGEGANDYAILEDGSNLLGGSFHGGETISNESYIIDGSSLSFGGNIATFDSLEIRQRTGIDWGNGVTQNVISSHYFLSDGGYEFSASFTGQVSSKTFYTAMHTTPERFTDIVFPRYIDLSLEADGFKSIDRSDSVIQEDPTENQRVTTKVGFSRFDYLNQYNGPSVRKVSGSYNKFYYGPIVGASDAFEFSNVTSSFSKVFS